MIVIFIIIGAFAFLTAYEMWWRKKQKHTEFDRKLVHVIASGFAAFSPFYLSWTDIRILSLAALFAIAVSKYTKLFKSLHSIDRTTFGELFFAASIGILTFITQDKGIYTAALLQMTLADSAAAIIGQKYGKNNKYKLWNQYKSIVGSTTFLVVSLVILLTYGLLASGNHLTVNLVFIAISLIIVENLSIYGSDDLTVPIIAAIMLRFLT